MIIDARTLPDSKNKVYEYLVSVNDDFTPRITTKTALKDYADKILKLANVYVSYEDNLIQGLIVFYTNNLETKESYGAFMSVAERYRGKGISRKLMDKFIEKSKEDGMSAATCHSNSPAAINLFRKYGFVEQSREKFEDEHIPDRLFFKKKL